MASGYTVAGRGDLDTIFAARTSAKGPDVGYAVAGVDISNRYEPRGATTPVANVGMARAGVDLSQYFMGINSGIASITNAQVTCIRTDGNSPAELHINADGHVYTRTAVTGLNDKGVWVTPASSAANFEVRLTVTSGTLTSGSNGVWERLNVNRKWTRSAAMGTTTQVDYTVEIRPVGGSTITSAIGILRCVT